MSLEYQDQVMMSPTGQYLLAVAVLFTVQAICPEQALAGSTASGATSRILGTRRTPPQRKSARAFRSRSPQPFAKKVERADSFPRFRRKKYRLVDPTGDANLIRRLDRVPVLLAKGLFHSLAKGEKGAGAARREVKIGKQRPIKVDALTNRLIKIIQGNYPKITPSLGQEHKWSPQARRYKRFGFWHRLGRSVAGKQAMPAPLLGRSKLFLTLACGWTGCFLPSGRERHLEQKLLKYKDRSVRMEDVLREGVILTPVMGGGGNP